MTEQNVIDYLETHPEFFNDNPELTHKIQLNFSKFKTSSLVEKCITNLKTENKKLKFVMATNLSISKDNVELSKRVHSLTLEIIKSRDLDQFIDCLQYKFKDLFTFDEVNILSSKAVDNAFITKISDSDKVSSFYQEGKIYYGTKQQHHLESICNADINSIVMINIGKEENHMIVLIGSTNADRFTPDKDHYFINNLQQIMEHKLDEFNQ